MVATRDRRLSTGAVVGITLGSLAVAAVVFWGATLAIVVAWGSPLPESLTPEAQPEATLEPTPTTTPEASEPPATKPPSTRPDHGSAAERRRDAEMTGAGFKVIERGSLYAMFAEDGTYGCGYLPCTAIHVYTEHGCPSRLYVEANVTSGGAAIGFVNATTGALSPGQSAALLLENHHGYGDAFQLTKVNCY